MTTNIIRRMLTTGSQFPNSILTNHKLSLCSNRQFSVKNLIASFLKSKDQKTTKPSSMSSAQELAQERQQLEAKIHDLVDKLESKKEPGQIRVSKDQIMRSKEEQDAANILEKLEIAEKGKESVSKATVAETKEQSALKANKQKGCAASSNESEKPIDISRLDLRIGKIVEVDKHPDADALYVEKIDCGDPTGPRTVISGLVKHVPIEEMHDRLVVVLCNLKPAKMRGILSEAMVMCASTPEKVELIKPPIGAKPGDRLVFDDYPGEPDSQLNPKKKIWEKVSPDIKTNDDGIALYKESLFKVSGLEGHFTSSLKNVNIR